MAAFGEQALGWFTAAEVVEAPSVAALVREHSGLLFRVAYSVVRNRSEAEDVVQDAFVRVLQQQEKLASVAEMRAWLVRIAWNLALDRKRRARVVQMDPEFAAGLAGRELPADVAIGERRRMQRVLAAMDRLPKLEREALLLSAMEELTTREIAAVLGRTESSVRALLFRARARLKARLAGEV